MLDSSELVCLPGGYGFDSHQKLWFVVQNKYIFVFVYIDYLIDKMQIKIFL